jgi:predicted Zn-dependent peptidase
MQFKQITLPNGLEIVAEVNPNALSASLGYFVKVGARHETQQLAGVSHFLEHMQFKGTPHRSAADVNRELDELGGHSNAYTAEDHTVYYLHVIPEYQSQAVALLTDIMRPSLREEDFETEKQVILEEIAMYDDQPPYGAFEIAMEQFYQDHPLGHRVLGTVDSVTGLTSTQMRGFHAQRYAPNNLVFVAAGAVDFDELTEQLKRLTNSWTATEFDRTNKLIPSSVVAFREEVIATANQQYVVGLKAGPSRHSDDRHALKLAASAIGDENGSRLFWALIDNGLADTACLFTLQFEDAGNVGLFLSCPPDAVQDNWERACNILQNSTREPLTKRELELVSNRVCASMILSAERPSSRLFSVGNNWMFRQRYETLEQSVERYASVDLDRLNDAAHRIVSAPMQITSVGPVAGALSV